MENLKNQKFARRGRGRASRNQRNRQRRGRKLVATSEIKQVATQGQLLPHVPQENAYASRVRNRGRGGLNPTLAPRISPVYEQMIHALFAPWKGIGLRLPARRPTYCAQAVLHDSVVVPPVASQTTISFGMFPHSRHSYSVTQSTGVYPGDGSAVDFAGVVNSPGIDAKGSPGTLNCSSVNKAIVPMRCLSEQIYGDVGFPVSLAVGITANYAFDVSSTDKSVRLAASNGVFKWYGYNTATSAWEQVVGGTVPNDSNLKGSVTLVSNYGAIKFSYTLANAMSININFSTHSPAPNTITVASSEVAFPLLATDYIKTSLVNQFRVTAMSVLVRNTTDASHDTGNIAIARTQRGWYPDGSGTLYSQIEKLPNSGTFNLANGAFAWWLPSSQLEEDFRSSDLEYSDMSGLIANVSLAPGASCAFDYHFAIEFQTTAQVFSQVETPIWTPEWESLLRAVGKMPAVSENPDHLKLFGDFLRNLPKYLGQGARFAMAHPELITGALSLMGV